MQSMSVPLSSQVQNHGRVADAFNGRDDSFDFEEVRTRKTDEFLPA